MEGKQQMKTFREMHIWRTPMRTIMTVLLSMVATSGVLAAEKALGPIKAVVVLTNGSAYTVSDIQLFRSEGSRYSNATSVKRNRVTGAIPVWHQRAVAIEVDFAEVSSFHYSAYQENVGNIAIIRTRGGEEFQGPLGWIEGPWFVEAHSMTVEHDQGGYPASTEVSLFLSDEVVDMKTDKAGTTLNTSKGLVIRQIQAVRFTTNALGWGSIPVPAEGIECTSGATTLKLPVADIREINMVKKMVRMRVGKDIPCSRIADLDVVGKVTVGSRNAVFSTALERIKSLAFE